MKKKLEKMDEEEEEDHSPSILLVPKLDGEKSPSKPDKQSTQDSTEKNNIEGIDEVMV